MTIEASDRICVGAIAGAFGVKGELRIKSFCANPEDIATYGVLTTEDGRTEYELRLIGPIKGGYSARIKGIRYRDQAEDLKGVGLYALRTALPNLPDNEFYYADLIGLDAFDTGGEKIGVVGDVANHGAGDVITIKEIGGKDLLLPFTLKVVPTVDLESKRIIVDRPVEVLAKEGAGE